MPKLNSVEPPKDPRHLGEAVFNYASHDGRYFIGTAPWMFETRWSSAGHGSAHLYNDPVGIEGVAIAEGISTIGQVTPDVVAAADFTSRTRTPGVGQVALLRNTAGFLAAVELLEVGKSSSPSDTVMRLRFAIQKDQSADFSPFASTFDDRQALVDQLLAVTANAERAIQAVKVGKGIESSEIGMGHNQPPSEFAITEDDRTETLAAITTIREEATSASPSISNLGAAGQKIARVVGKIAKWLSGKANVAADEFAKTVGKAIAVGVAGIPIWMSVQTKLTELMVILANF